MSRFYLTGYGERGTVTKTGRKELNVHIRGWDYGVKVKCFYDGEKETFEIYETGGSNDDSSILLKNNTFIK